MKTLPRRLLDIAVRGGALLAGHWTFTRIWDATTAGPHETDIGGGMVGLGLVVLAALVWGGLDGRNGELRQLTLTWVGAGLVGGAFAAVALALEGGEPSEVLFAIAVIPAFLTALIAAPAVIAGAFSGGPSHRAQTPG